MNVKHMILTALLAVGFSIWLGQNVLAQTRLGLHVTKEELEIWRQRAQNGPYKTQGDVSKNSPGAWERILNKANSFRSKPSQERWKGQVQATPITNDNDSNIPPARNLGEKLRDAAFVYLITGETSYRDAVRNELLAQAQEPGTNWKDKKRWDPNVLTTTGRPTLDLVMWLNKLLFGYDYIRSSLKQSDRETLDTWFLAAGLFFETQPAWVARVRFPNRDKDDYSTPPKLGKQARVVFHGGPTVYFHHGAWGNQQAAGTRFSTLVGIMLDNEFLKKSGKRWVKEAIKYAVFPEGAIGDFKRWKDDHPCLGWAYSGAVLGSIVTIADHFARDGDLELYEYETTEGLLGTKGHDQRSGKPKSLHTTIRFYLDYVDGTIKRYGTDSKSHAGKASWQIASECPKPNSNGVWRSIRDVWSAPANIFYQDSHIKHVYMRTAPNTPPYPAKPETGGYEPWGGDQGIYPDVLFMFGQMEGKVWPYPTTKVLVKSPENLRFIE